MRLDGHRIIRSTLDRHIVGNSDAPSTFNAPDPSNCPPAVAITIPRNVRLEKLFETKCAASVVIFAPHKMRDSQIEPPQVPNQKEERDPRSTVSHR